MAEQRYQAVLGVIGDGRTVTEAAGQWMVSRATLHTWLARYEARGLEGLADRAHRPGSCPHQMPAAVEARVLELRAGASVLGAAADPAGAGPLGGSGGALGVGELPVSGPGRGDRPVARRRRGEKWKRWERPAPMELWQLDVVGGFLLADGSTAKALTGVDDHSRFCVSARLLPRERTQAVCEGLAAGLRAHGVPEQILTDQGKVFTGRFGHPPTEVLFDRICRENGIEHLLTRPSHRPRLPRRIATPSEAIDTASVTRHARSRQLYDAHAACEVGRALLRLDSDVPRDDDHGCSPLRQISHTTTSRGTRTHR